MISYSNFERIYDKYSPMLYGVASEICHSKMKTEKLLESIFEKMAEQEKSSEKYSVYCLREIIHTAQSLYPDRFISYFGLRQFKNTPLINHLICNQISLQDYCKKKYLTKQEGLQIIRKEFNKIRNSCPKEVEEHS